MSLFLRGSHIPALPFALASVCRLHTLLALALGWVMSQRVMKGSPLLEALSCFAVFSVVLLCYDWMSTKKLLEVIIVLFVDS
jgi:hypothetical protein